jgi:hypothetical protein
VPQFSKQEQRLGSYAQTLTRKRRQRELMRLRAIDLATAGAEMKMDEQRGGRLRGNVTDALKRN